MRVRERERESELVREGAKKRKKQAYFKKMKEVSKLVNE